MRQGLKKDMDPNKMLPGELAVPLDSQEVYACFAPGNVQRLATHEAMKNQILDATEEIVSDLTTEIVTATANANTASSEATSAALNANAVADRAQEVVDDAELILSGDLSNKTVAFTQSANKTNIVSGESFKVMFGKIMKYFFELKDGAFADIVNNLTNTVEGSSLDSTQGKYLNDNKANDTQTFTQYTSRTNLVSGERISVSHAKIMKWFTDLKDGAFSTVSNLLTITATGYVLDARAGKTLNDNITNIWKTMYPVGSIYFTTVSTNPGTTWGGTWVAWGTGKVPVAVDTSQTEFNAVEKTGGEKTHVTTINEMPSHNHVLYSQSGTPASGWTDNNFLRANDVAYTVNKTSNSAGGGAAHNNLQPYITCYMWKRTA